MVSYQEALHLVLERIRPLPAIDVPLEKSGGLVLAEDITAQWDMPSSDNSAMDGFAFAWNDGLAGRELRVVGNAYAGIPWQGSLGPGEALRIMTGAPLPHGCDSVLPLEDVVAGEGSIWLPETITQGQHVRCQGEEFRAGECLLKAGTPLHAWEIGLLATAGFARVRVHPAPCVVLLSTGDELVQLGQTPGPGQIVNSNLYLLSACLREAGCQDVPLAPCCDEPELLRQQLEAAGKKADLILSTGGVSVGDRDYLRVALTALRFETVFWQVAIKPGKPVLFGLLDGRPLFGLPGNPAAAAATFELFVRPALRRLSGHLLVSGETRRGVLTETVRGAGKREAFLWCRLEWDGDHYRVHVPKRQGSGQNRSLQEVNGLLAVPVGVEKLVAGDIVEVQIFRGAGR